MDDKLEILFARAEALHGHGHSREAVKLAVKLAEELLQNPPDLLAQVPPTPTKGKKKKNQGTLLKISTLASNTLAKVAFLCVTP
ncbi:PREDICTED: zinc finger SWIM domain-containing protein 8-like [Priapulus caudatus]|uniref:Zinc finger SWIM domain-containing protein 8-like n=1 Tax=Priapulus caudatus TaxID=37621 RepID=A0ABM1F354_PRICU|nr:PREDICTED: zinc finger SWIM domain-containing protein 8-like [Priapulus caudatus]